MSDIIKDIVEDIEIKPNRTKFILKWGGRIAIFLIGIAFVFGQLKSLYVGKLDKLEKTLDDNTKSINELKQDMNAGFEKVNAKIDKVYDDGYKAFDDFQQYNNKQFGIIIDYGRTDKDLLKRMIELNTFEKTKSVENQIQHEKKENYSIGVKPTENK